MLFAIAVITALLVPAPIACAQEASAANVTGSAQQVPSKVIVLGAGAVTVNGTYCLGSGTCNGQPYWSMGAFYLFYSGSFWVICHCEYGINGEDKSGCYKAEDLGPELGNIVGPWTNFGSSLPVPTVRFGS
jgi:hypothetical protein